MSSSKQSSISGLDQPNGLRSELPPLSAADFRSTNFLSDILGLSPTSFPSHGSVSNSGRVVRTLQCGDYKYPDVTSPLNRILCRNWFGRREPALENADLPMSRSCSSTHRHGDSSMGSFLGVPNSVFSQDGRGGLGGDEGQLMDQIFGMDHNSGSPYRPPPSSFRTPSGAFDFISNEGGHLTKPAENKGLSPQSDIGYGTSLGSNASHGQSLRRDIDIEGLSDLIRDISMNTLTMRVPGSPLCSSSDQRGSHFGKSCCGGNLNVLQSSGMAHPDAQAAKQKIHHHHHSHMQAQDQDFLQNLDQCFNSVGSGGGLLGEDNRLNQSFDEHFGANPTFGNKHSTDRKSVV